MSNQLYSQHLTTSKSGDTLSFGRTVIKRSINSRLLLQADKQEYFQHDFIKTPQVIDSGWKDDAYYFEMEYVAAPSYAQYLEYAAPHALENFDIVLDWIHGNLLQSKWITIDGSVLFQKAESCTKDKRILNIFKSYLNPHIKIPIGKMHGDLTLSNILYDGRFWFIDFLDGIFDSPLMDIAKLRQDTLHSWSAYCLQSLNPRMQISLDYLDAKIRKRFYNYQSIIPLQLLSLIRIIPYEDSDFLRNEIFKYEDTNFACRW